jgi:hypothetical protein
MTERASELANTPAYSDCLPNLIGVNRAHLSRRKQGASEHGEHVSGLQYATRLVVR